MEAKLEDIQKLAEKLSIKERASLAHHLIQSLDENKSNLSEKEIEQHWIEEAKKRSNDLKEGKSISRPVKDVLNDLKSQLK